MIPFVLGGIALAAVGYKVLEYCNNDGCYQSESGSTVDKKDINNEKHSLDKGIYMELGRVLENITKSKHKIDESVVLFEEIYGESMTDVSWSNVVCEPIGDQEKIAYLCLCSEVLEEAYSAGEFYADRMKNILEQKRKVFSELDERMIEYAFLFCNTTRSILAHRVVDDDNNISVDVLQSYAGYKEELAKHKMKISFFRCGRENYSLFLTGFEKSV